MVEPFGVAGENLSPLHGPIGEVYHAVATVASREECSIYVLPRTLRASAGPLTAPLYSLTLESKPGAAR